MRPPLIGLMQHCDHCLTAILKAAQAEENVTIFIEDDEGEPLVVPVWTSQEGEYRAIFKRIDVFRYSARECQEAALDLRRSAN